MVLLAMAGSGQEQPKPITPTALLSDDEVKLGLSGKGKDHWVLIQDMGLMAAQGNQVPRIIIYMPEAVLAMRAESAQKQFTQYVPVEEDMRRSLMIVAQGYAGKTIAEGCTSITRVVLLSDPFGGIVQEGLPIGAIGASLAKRFRCVESVPSSSGQVFACRCSQGQGSGSEW